MVSGNGDRCNVLCWLEESTRIVSRSGVKVFKREEAVTKTLGGASVNLSSLSPIPDALPSSVAASPLFTTAMKIGASPLDSLRISTHCAVFSCSVVRQRRMRSLTKTPGGVGVFLSFWNSSHCAGASTDPCAIIGGASCGSAERWRHPDRVGINAVAATNAESEPE